MSRPPWRPGQPGGTPGGSSGGAPGGPFGGTPGGPLGGAPGGPLGGAPRGPLGGASPALAAARPAPPAPLAGAEPPSRLDELRARPRRENQAGHFYRDFGFRSDAVKVLPGEFYVDHQEILIVTVLGSCIAACIHDRVAGVGGMNHFMLPDGAGDSSGRYGAYAMELLINELLKRGASRSRLEAKVFGGGRVLQGFTSINIGEQNAAFVERFLAAERIPIVSRDVLDVHPRKVCFFPVSGRALVKKLAAASADPALAEESRYRQRIVKAPAAGSVELF